jgi:hypothetical protein
MLSELEKKEIIEDAQSKSRMENLRFTKGKTFDANSFDDYLLFLDSVQRIFSHFIVSQHKTITKLNKL